MKKFDVLVVGEINPDLILRGDVMPELGQVEKYIDSADLVIGSSSVIFACGVAKLGLKVAMAGKIGEDAFGAFMLSEMKARGINTESVSVDPHLGTGLTVIFSHGVDRGILTYAGAMHSLRLQDIRPQWIEQTRHLHLGSYFLHDQLIPDVPALFRMAHQAGASTSLDTNYDPHERWQGVEDVLHHTDYFLPNEAELTSIAGLSDVPGALARLAQLGPTVAVKRGAQGASAMRGQEIWHAESIPVQVVDTTGAGDTFDAGFIYAALQGWPMERCLRMGTVCGALSTQAVGGTAAQPCLEQVVGYL